MKSTTQHIYIEDAEDESPTLELGIVGGTVFIAIGKMEETTKVRTFTAEAQMAVDVLTLTRHLESLVALEMARRDDAR